MMLTLKNLYDCYSASDSNNDITIKLLRLLKCESLVLIDGWLINQSRLNILDYLHYSSSVISVGKSLDYVSPTEKMVNEMLENEMVVNKIVKAVNHIVIKEDRIIFIERYIYHYSANKIKQLHYLSQRAYSMSLITAQHDFLVNMGLNMNFY